MEDASSPASGLRTYLDYAGATPVREAAQKAFLDAIGTFGNPGALHAEALAAGALLDDARTRLAHELGCRAHEIAHTSGGTEGNNLAILGAFEERVRAGVAPERMHWITSAIEHPSVLECFRHIEARGGAVTYLAPEADGHIDPSALAAALRPETALVSIGLANGEIGTIQPLSRIARAIRAHEAAQGTRVIFHADAGQAPLYLSPQVHTLGVDLLTLDGGKLGSPRGIGALFVKDGTKIAPLLYGGSQESGLRPGTENVALAYALSAALEDASRERDAEARRLALLREALCARIIADPALAGSVVNGASARQSPHLLNVSIPGIDNEYLTLALDRAGFAVATKSACKEGERASHVIAAIAPEREDAWRAMNALRISMGPQTSEGDIERFAEALSGAVAAYRAHT